MARAGVVADVVIAAIISARAIRLAVLSIAHVVVRGTVTIVDVTVI